MIVILQCTGLTGVHVRQQVLPVEPGSKRHLVAAEMAYKNDHQGCVFRWTTSSMCDGDY
jgi:hypothetical protein